MLCLLAFAFACLSSAALPAVLSLHCSLMCLHPLQSRSRLPASCRLSSLSPRSLSQGLACVVFSLFPCALSVSLCLAFAELNEVFAELMSLLKTH